MRRPKHVEHTLRYMHVLANSLKRVLSAAGRHADITCCATQGTAAATAAQLSAVKHSGGNAAGNHLTLGGLQER